MCLVCILLLFCMKKLKLSIVILQVDVSSAVAYVMSVREDQELNHVKVSTNYFEYALMAAG